MKLEVRKLVTYVEDTFIEGGKAAERPLKLFAAAAVLRNPWAGRGFVEDLRPEIHATRAATGRDADGRDPAASPDRARRSRVMAKRRLSGRRARSNMRRR